MKKKIFAVLLVLTMAFSLTACGGSKSGAPAKVDEIPAGYESISNVGYDIGSNWIYDTDLSGTKRYTTADAMEAFAIAVQNEDGYTAADMLAAYKSQVEVTYGTTYDDATTTIGGRDWYTMKYSTDNILSTSVEVNIYIYAEKGTVIYIEDAVNVEAGAAFQGYMDSVIESIVIKK